MKLTAILYFIAVSISCAAELSLTTEHLSTNFKFPEKKLVLSPKDAELESLLEKFSRPQDDESLLALFTEESKPTVNSILKDEKAGKAYRNLLSDIAKITPVLLIVEDDRHYIAITQWDMKSGSKFFHLMSISKQDNKLNLVYKSLDVRSPEFALTDMLTRHPDSVNAMKIVTNKN